MARLASKPVAIGGALPQSGPALADFHALEIAQGAGVKVSSGVPVAKMRPEWHEAKLMSCSTTSAGLPDHARRGPAAASRPAAWRWR
jgi:hypothetical protein